MKEGRKEGGREEREVRREGGRERRKEKKRKNIY